MKINFDINALKTPYYIVDEALLTENLEVLKSVKDATGCKILLAQKAFSMFHFYPLIAKYLDGATSSGLFEAKLSHKYFSGENHVFSPAFTDENFDELLSICDHFVFNSKNQLEKFRDPVLKHGKNFGIRINPNHSTQEAAIYDPCAYGSRFGVLELTNEMLKGVKGLHFHTLCEQNSDALLETLSVVEKKFGAYLRGLEWINFGGGHHITRADYDIKSLISTINRIKSTYNVQVYLEPGEAVALNTGFLVTTVIDVVENGLTNLILDTSAACHMPDVIEMPYRPPLLDSGFHDEKAFTYRLCGPTCLSGDIISDYSFDREIKIGDKLVFSDMAHYSMVKNNTFNGMPLPTIAACDLNGNVSVVKSFSYEDFEQRLS